MPVAFNNLSSLFCVNLYSCTDICSLKSFCQILLLVSCLIPAINCSEFKRGINERNLQKFLSYESEYLTSNFKDLNERIKNSIFKTDDTSKLITIKIFLICYELIDKWKKLVRDDEFIKKG